MPDTAAAPQMKPLVNRGAMQAAYLKGSIKGALSLIECGYPMETIARVLRNALTEAGKIGEGK